MFPWTLLDLSIYTSNSFKAPQIFIGSKTLKWKMPVTARCKAVEWVMCLSTAARPRIQVFRTGVWFRISESGVGMGRRISIWWNTHISLEPQTHSNTLRWIYWQVQGKGKYKVGGSNRGGQQGSEFDPFQIFVWQNIHHTSPLGRCAKKSSKTLLL